MSELLDRSVFFEDFKEGMKIKTHGRTLLQSDIMSFAGLTGDFNPIHVNSEYAKDTVFGRNIAHGMLTFSVATGLSILTGFMDRSIIAFDSVENWKFKRPVFPGDTVHVVIICQKKEKYNFRGNVTGGLVKCHADVINQKNKICQSGILCFFVQNRS